MLEVGGEADVQGPAVSHRKKGKGEEGELGRQLGSIGRTGARWAATREKEVRSVACSALWAKGKRKDGLGRKGPVGLKAREGEERRFETFPFFQNLFNFSNF
jgi:hypothetical protein